MSDESGDRKWEMDQVRSRLKEGKFGESDIFLLT